MGAEAHLDGQTETRTEFLRDAAGAALFLRNPHHWSSSAATYSAGIYTTGSYA